MSLVWDKSSENLKFFKNLDFFLVFIYTECMKQERKTSPGRRSTVPANRFSQLLNEELRAAQSRRRLTLRALEELSGVSRNRLSLTLNLDSSPLNTNEFELICRALDLSPAEVCFRAEAALQKELAAETSSASDKELAAQILARAEAARQAGYALAAHPVDKVITDDGNWTA